MNSQTARKRQLPEIDSMEGKIHLLRTLDIRESDISGPVTSLFFHELEHVPKGTERFRDTLAGSLLFISWTFLRPLLYLLYRGNGQSQVYQTTTIHGFKGGVYTIRRYDTGTNNPSGFERFMLKSGLYKLPMSVPLMKGQITLYGPEPLDSNFSMELVDRYTDFYKRYSVYPGYFSPASFKRSDDPGKVLQAELNRISRDTGKRNG